MALQNLEVMYDQFVAKDGRKGVDWTEVAVCIVQVRGAALPCPGACACVSALIGKA